LFEAAIILSRILGKSSQARENAVYMIIRNSCMIQFKFIAKHGLRIHFYCTALEAWFSIRK